MIVIGILQLIQIGESVVEVFEYVFYIALPNFCFHKALQDLVLTHRFPTICSEIDENVNRTVFCELLRINNQTNPCCASELNVSLSTS